MLKNHPIAIGMDGKGRWVDNVFIERLWRSVKYEDVYLRAYETAILIMVDSSFCSLDVRSVEFGLALWAWRFRSDG